MKEADNLLQSLKNNEKNAFKRFFHHYYGLMVLFSTSIIEDVDAAEDVTQETFLDFWIHKRYMKISASLDSYIHQAIKHASLNYIRNKNRREIHQENAINISFDEDTYEKEQIQIDILYKAIDNLPEERRKIFLMVYTEDLKYQQVADKLGISINTVKTQLARAIKTLRYNLKSDFELLILCFLLKK